VGCNEKPKRRWWDGRSKEEIVEGGMKENMRFDKRH